MTRGIRQADVVVIGGGPAGATAATLLASWGRSVVLVHHASGRPDLAESLPPSSRKLLGYLGQLDAVDAARFHPNRGNVSFWAGAPGVATSGDSGYHVLRGDFDRRLREHACTHGVSIADGQVRTVEGDGPVFVHVVAPGGERGERSQIAAEFVLDCSGRAGVVARRGWRRLDAGYRTLAVAGEWTSTSWPEGEDDHTVVESYADGWAWSVPLSATRRQCTVMVEWDHGQVRKASLRDLYHAELAKAVRVAERLEQASSIGEPWACDATLYRSSRAADGRMLLVGDAASFIEPLSAAGVKKALASAWRAAVVVHTCLRSAGMKTPAFDLFDHREQQVYADCARRAGAFFQEAANAHGGKYWAARAALSHEGRAPAALELLERDPTGDPAVREVFAELRVRQDVGLAVAPQARLAKTAVIEGNEIVMRDGVVIAGLDRPLRFAGGVNLPALVEAVSSGSELTSVLNAYRRLAGTGEPAEILAGLAVLAANHILEFRRPDEQESMNRSRTIVADP